MVDQRIERNVLRPIDLLVERNHGAAAVILILAGVDAMANVNRPEAADDSAAEDFKVWVRSYFQIGGETEITPAEWWEARNAILHTFGVYSRRHRRSGLRILGWGRGFTPPVLYDPAIDPNVVLVEIGAMRDAFRAGVERFITETLSDHHRRELIQSRLDLLLEHYPYE